MIKGSQETEGYPPAKDNGGGGDRLYVSATPENNFILNHLCVAAISLSQNRNPAPLPPTLKSNDRQVYEEYMKQGGKFKGIPRARTSICGPQRRGRNRALPPSVNSRSSRQGGYTARDPHRRQHAPVIPLLRISKEKTGIVNIRRGEEGGGVGHGNG